MADFAEQFRPERDRIVVIADHDAGHLGVDDDGEGGTFLRMLALVPEAQGGGIGTALVRDVVREAHEAGRPVVLRVTENNAGARRLYERLGFAVARVVDEPEKRVRKFELISPPPRH